MRTIVKSRKGDILFDLNLSNPPRVGERLHVKFFGDYKVKKRECVVRVLGGRATSQTTEEEFIVLWVG